MRTLIAIAALCLTSLIASAATVDGVAIHYTSHGSGSKTVMFVHGWTCDETSWQEQVPALEKNYRVITMDLPGHGKSGAPTKGVLSMDLFARAIEAVRVEAKAQKIVLVGHSMGTPVILTYAHLYPANVAGLVPVDGGIALRGGTPNVAFLQGPEGPKNRENMIRGMFGSGATPVIQDHILKMMLGPSETMATQAFATMNGSAAWANDTITVPALGVYANGVDEKAFKKLMPNGRVVNMPAVGHFLMLEKPAEFNKLLTDFLATVKF